MACDVARSSKKRLLSSFTSVKVVERTTDARDVAVRDYRNAISHYVCMEAVTTQKSGFCNVDLPKCAIWNCDQTAVGFYGEKSKKMHFFFFFS